MNPCTTITAMTDAAMPRRSSNELTPKECSARHRVDTAAASAAKKHGLQPHGDARGSADPSPETQSAQACSSLDPAPSLRPWSRYREGRGPPRPTRARGQRRHGDNRGGAADLSQMVAVRSLASDPRPLEELALAGSVPL